MMPQDDLGSSIGGAQADDLLLLTSTPAVIPPVIPPSTPSAGSVAMFIVRSRASGTEDVPAGSIAVAVNGTFVAPYNASLVPSWATDYFIAPADKLATGFTAGFTVPPAADAFFDWSVGGS